jgi:hypothetical protein
MMGLDQRVCFLRSLLPHAAARYQLADPDQLTVERHVDGANVRYHPRLGEHGMVVPRRHMTKSELFDWLYDTVELLAGYHQHAPDGPPVTQPA